MTNPEWTSTASLPEIADWLQGKRSVVLLTHAKPDGDAMGSTLALARAINRSTNTSGAASTAECWYMGPMPAWHKLLTASTKVRHIDPGERPEFTLDPEAIIVCDTGTWGQLDGYADWLRARADRACVIDHHLQGDPDTAPRRHLATSAAAVCQPVAELCRLLLGLSSLSELPTEVAEPLYFGIATDTGWFKHGNVSADVMRTAGDLLACAVNHERLYQATEMNDRPERLRLMARALASLELHQDDTIALMSLTPKDLEASGAAPGDSGGFVDIPRTVGKIRVSALLTEIEAPDHSRFTKISLRSKGGDHAVDVNQVAQKLGGGGHARAAGARVMAPLADTKAKLLEALA
ncbi:MAG: bifunctional oligoribonuclease/PAP phosphatase NrnA [Phycisphaerales bacterium JB059]